MFAGEMMKVAYERLFVAFYAWSLKVDGKKGGYNVYYATLMMSFALFLNISSVTMIIDMLVPNTLLLELTNLSKVWWILSIVLFSTANYLYFASDNRFRRLIVASGQNADDLAKRSHRNTLIYMVASVALVILLLIVGFE
jgi:hypothetical protein